MTLLENDIKASVLNYLFSKGRWSSQDIAINELPVEFHNRRVDLVTLGNDLEAFEIKSSADKLTRLSGQVEAYLKYFDKVTVVADQKHISSVLKNTPEQVAVWECDSKRVVVRRRGKKNRQHARKSYLELMHLTEIERLVRRYTTDLNSESRLGLYNYAEKIPLNVVRKECFAALRKRYQQSNDLFWKHYLKDTITPMGVKLLSVSAGVRAAEDEIINKQIEAFKKWASVSEFQHDDPDMLKLAEDRLGPTPLKIRNKILSYKSSVHSSSVS